MRRKTSLEEALCSGSLEVWKYLLKCNSTIVAETCSCDFDLHSAVRAGQVEIVEEIANKEASKVKSDRRSCGCAVYIAVENGNEEILKILLTAGFSIRSFLGLNPLHVAATFEHTRLVDILLKFGANINSKTDEQKITPLDFAAAAGHANMVKFLLGFGADPMENGSSLTSLYYALHRLPDDASETSVTPLIFQNLLKITEMLLIAGVNKINIRDCEKIIVNASKLIVSSDDEQTSSCLKEVSNEGNVNDEKNNKNREFHPEIIRCLLNYLPENEVNCVLNKFSLSYSSKIVFVIMEYYDYRNTYFLGINYWKIVHMIDRIEDIDYLLKISWHYKIHRNIFKMIVARLELLLCDQQVVKKISFYNLCMIYFDWREECQQ